MSKIYPWNDDRKEHYQSELALWTARKEKVLKNLVYDRAHRYIWKRHLERCETEQGVTYALEQIAYYNDRIRDGKMILQWANNAIKENKESLKIFFNIEVVE